MIDFRLSKEAGNDLEGIYDFIAQSDPLAASAYVQEFLDLFRLMVSSPGMGRLRPDLRPGVRSHVYGYYVIIYKEKAEYIHVSRIIHGARDVKRVLEEESYGE